MDLEHLGPFDTAQGFDGLRRLSGRKVVDRVRRRGSTWEGKDMKMIYVTSRGASTAPRLRHAERSAEQELSTESRHVAGLAQHDVPQLLVGTLASTHLDKSAVKRNRMRRRCREALRIVLLAYRLPLTAHVQLLISPRSSSLTCPFPELLEDIRAFLTHLKHYG